MVERIRLADADAFVGLGQVEVIMAAGSAIHQPAVVLDVEGEVDDDGLDFVQMVDQVVMFVGSGFQHDDSPVLSFAWRGA
ncbi:hypothetical protein AO896_29550 [Pseudomonas aeruginosa]|nr:hypothetical protein [Pseudomonas aeruginosa]NQA99617.1 hypothetical protein [Pseudomonas paraeruginosa]KSC92215.2 hypothetical protein AO896_29550 [Pseudomonas aeruginosa]KSD19439.2 hypothetical protein AO898_30050 [Pseudomonas aeruginosa]KSG46497.2 hypothetical protein AO955_31735 [Pseudomonas aeruginosa]MCW8362278.1 hypothetical protein [Pseudomonas aeruginosa]